MANIVSCALAKISAFYAGKGETIDEAALQKQLGKDPHAWAAYGEARAAQEAGVFAGLLPTEGLVGKGLHLLKSAGLDVAHAYAYIANPDAILGKDITGQVEQVYSKYMKRALANDWGSVQREHEWNNAPLGAGGRRDILDIAHQNRFSVDADRKQYFNNYMEQHAGGVSLFGSKVKYGMADPVVKGARNVSENYISWNPVLAAYHMLEFSPKALAYAIDKGGVINGPLAVIKGLGDFAKATGVNITKKLPELESKGVYGTRHETGGIAGLNRLVDVVEHPIRGSAYYIGEAIKPGSGTEAVEKIAFVHRMGNEPISSVHPLGFLTLGFMRYSVASTKLISSLVKNSLGGNMNSMAALTAFAAVNAIQTGGKSIIPAPVWGLLPQQWQQGMQDFDDKTHLNVVKQLTGSDFSSKMRPLTVPSVGIPLAMEKEYMDSAGTSFRHASTDAQEGNAAGSTLNIAKGLMSVGQLGKIPGVNNLTLGVVKAIADAADHNIPSTPQAVAGDYAEKTHLYIPPGK